MKKGSAKKERVFLIINSLARMFTELDDGLEYCRRPFSACPCGWKKKAFSSHLENGYDPLLENE